MQEKILEIFIIQDKKLLIYLMIMLKLDRKLCIGSYVLFPAKQGTVIKILTPTQLLQRLPIALAQVKAGNKSDSLLNEIRQIVYSLYQSKNY